MDVTYILNLYRRPHILAEQIQSIKNQTISPSQIMIWRNSYNGIEIPEEIRNDKDLIIADCNKNLGVWSRFMFALNVKTKYFCVVDDDTIVGSKWSENCLSSMMEKPGLYGTRGLRFKNGSYFQHDVLGWESNNEKIERVDIVGHSWFGKREMLAHYWSELPPERFFSAGEDIHFSFSLQKFGINTYVPPHPKSDREMSGSLKPLEYGQGKEATSNFGMPEMNDYLQHVRSRGFKLINE